MAAPDPQHVDLERLAAWMDRAGLPPGPLEDVEQLPGGTQNILVRFARGGRSYVLRRPPPHLRANSNETMRREARVLAAAVLGMIESVVDDWLDGDGPADNGDEAADVVSRLLWSGLSALPEDGPVSAARPLSHL